MSDYLVTDTELTGIANAIRTKGETSGQLTFPAGFTSAVNAIPKHFWEGANMEFVQDLATINWTLDDTSYSSWTPSGTQTMIKDRTDAATFVADMTNYDYLIQWKVKIIPQYSNDAEKKGYEICDYATANSYMCRLPSNYTKLRTNSYNSSYSFNSVYRDLYVLYDINGNMNMTYAPGYGIYTGSSAVSFSSTASDNPTITIKTPTIYVRCSNSHFSTANATKINTTNTTINMVASLYRFQLGDSFMREMYKQLIDWYNEDNPQS